LPLLKWDFEFVNIKVTELCNLIKAANYLNIPELLNLTIAAIASLIIKGKNTRTNKKSI